VEQEWLLAWSQQAPGATLSGFRGTRSELANQVVFGELNRLVREESVQRSNEEKIRQEEAMGKFSPYLQKMIADGTLCAGGDSQRLPRNSK